jgi:methionine--tRNA ligase beta chain
VNIASRAAGFITKRFGGRLLPVRPTLPQVQVVQATGDSVAACYETREYGKALREVMHLIDQVNAWIDQAKPWELARNPGNDARLHELCSEILNVFRLITVLLKPVLPKLARDVEVFLNSEALDWRSLGSLLAAGHQIRPYSHLMTRVEAKQIRALVDANRDTLHPSPPGRGAGGEGSSRKTPLPSELVDLARKLRQEQTDAEQLIWHLLRDRRVGAKFRRQHPVEITGKRYVLDFYSHELGLAIELDGGQHQETTGSDEARTDVLNSAGIRVIRFWNNDVLQNTRGVLESIWNDIMEARNSDKSTSSLTPNPSPEGRGVITIEDFAKLDLRIARVRSAEHVEGADKLLKITLDVGPLGTRQVFAGIKSSYDPEQLQGKLTVLVANLAPRKMKFGVSEGMVLAASGDAGGPFLLWPDTGAEPGMKVK